MSELTHIDYQNILKFYKKPIPKSERLLKLQAERIMATKLCRCIKKIDKNNESRSIGICTKTIINNKGFKRGNFSCKKKQKNILIKKNKTKKVSNKYIK